MSLSLSLGLTLGGARTGGGTPAGSITGTPPVARLGVPYSWAPTLTGVGLPTQTGTLPPGLTYSAPTISGTPV